MLPWSAHAYPPSCQSQPEYLTASDHLCRRKGRCHSAGLLVTRVISFQIAILRAPQAPRWGKRSPPKPWPQMALQWSFLTIMPSNKKHFGAQPKHFGPSMETTISAVPRHSVDLEMQPQTDHEILVRSNISHIDSTVVWLTVLEVGIDLSKIISSLG